MMGPRKEAICNALAAFIRQRPGFDPRNYGDAASYRADVRAAGKDKQQAETLLAAVRWRDSITAEDMLKDRGGRLSVKAVQGIAGGHGATPGRVETRIVVDYTAGQYWCTEYRAGVARYLASLLWDYTREHAMPKPSPSDLYHDPHTGEHVNAGAWLRSHFRKEFGSSIQRRWFN